MANRDAIGVESVRALFDAYCACIDGRDLPALADVFAPGCQVSFGDVDIDGFPALLAFLEEGLARFDATRHVVSDIELEARAEGGPRSLSRITAWHRFVKERPDLTIHGHYRDVFVQTDTGWRIAEHRGSENRREQSPRAAGGSDE